MHRTNTGASALIHATCWNVPGLPLIVRLDGRTDGRTVGRSAGYSFVKWLVAWLTGRSRASVSTEHVRKHEDFRGSFRCRSFCCRREMGTSSIFFVDDDDDNDGVVDFIWK